MMWEPSSSDHRRESGEVRDVEDDYAVAGDEIPCEATVSRITDHCVYEYAQVADRDDIAVTAITKAMRRGFGTVPRTH